MTVLRQPLAPTEWRLFRVVLRHPPGGATVEWVRSQLAEERATTTVATLLSRIREKGWIRSESGPSAAPPYKETYFYFPVITSESALAEMIAHLMQEYDFTPEELAQALAMSPA